MTSRETADLIGTLLMFAPAILLVPVFVPKRLENWIFGR